MILHSVVFLTINKNYPDMDLYGATRFAWKVNKEKAESMDYVLPVYFGMIMGAFKVHEWLLATREHFPDRTDAEHSDRFGFVGRKAHPNVWKYYQGMSAPDDVGKSQNPVRYMKID